MKLRLVFLALALSATPVVGSAAFITNGSLTGSIANNGVPSGWTTLVGSPDTMDEFNNVGVSVGFVVAPAGPSPDGGTWVGIGRDGSFVEAFGQTVSGLSVGSTYSLSWYAGNFGAVISCPLYCLDNAIEILIDGVSIGTGSALSPGADWFAQSLQFTATAASHDLRIQLAGTAASYMSIDGIALNAVGAVPEPGTLALLGLGLAGIGAMRRRKH